MAISERLKTFLDASNIRYTAAKHPVVYTAQEIAASQHVPGRQLAKCVLVKTDRGPALAVLPAVELVNLKKLKDVLRAKTLAIAKEADIKAAFPDVEVGAMSPFGTLYQVPVVVDRSLEATETIVFNAGSHTETITMRTQDFLTLVKPKSGAFGQPIGGKSGAKKSASKKKPAKTARRAATRPRPKPAVRRRAKSKRR